MSPLPEDLGAHFESIYAGEAERYHALVMREDLHGRLPAALAEILPADCRVAVELGAGTGRVTKILARQASRVLAFDRSAHMLAVARRELAEEPHVTFSVAPNESVPVPDATADAVVEGWSFGHAVSARAEGWQERAESLLRESFRVLRPGGTLVLVETQGTGTREPRAPGPVLPLFYDWLVRDRGFSSCWIRTDYLFPTMEEAQRLVAFFFGSMVEHEVRPDGTVIVPECTGLWWTARPA
jgi:ubiquinone/menaquinone biosynthesis C-methylase UbiE